MPTPTNGASQNPRENFLLNRMAQAASRFTKLFEAPARPDTDHEEAAKPDKLTAEEKLARSCGEWALAAPQEFSDFLNEWIDELDKQRREAIDSHARTAYFAGAEDILLDLRTQFNSWRGITPPGAPPRSPDAR